jgi:hypothetical protein
MVAPIRFLSGRQQQQKIGVEGSTENKKVLEVVGRVGIGSTIFEPAVTLDVRGDLNVSGSLSIGGTTGGGEGLSSDNITVSGLSSTKDLYVSGFSTFKNVVDIDSNTYISGKLGIGTDVAPIGKFEVAGGESNFRGDVNIYNDLFVAGNVSVAGSSVTLDTETVRVEDKDIVLGFTTTVTPNDITANHGGIAIASTEGSPLVPLYAVGINTLPDTYKQFMWVKSGTYAGMTTDAWISNYAISIGNTSIEEGVTLKVGTGTTEIRMYGNTGIISAYRYYGSGGFLDDIIKEKLEGITAVLVDSVGTATTLGEERRVADLFIDNSNASVGYITAVGFGSTAIYYFNDVTAIGLTTDANVNTSGIITAFGFEANGGTFTGDGSGLTGLAGVAAGVTVADNDIDVGTASRLNFGPDIDVSAISAGIVTMSLNANQNFAGIVTVSTLDVTNLDADNAIIGLATVSELTGINTLGIGTVFEIKSSPSNNGSLIFEAPAGEVLTLTNNLTEGSLFSISDEFGVPTFDSNADGTVSIVPYNVGHYLGIGKTNPQAKLDVSGNALVSGRIGVGTTNPQAKLDIWAGAANTTYFRGGTGNPARQLQIRSEGTVTPGAAHIFNAPSVSGTLIFETNNTEVIRINNSQNVGIGTISPTQKLDVNGNTRLRGALYDFNNATGNPGELLTSIGTGVSWTTSTTTPSGRSVTSIASSTTYYITASETSLGVSTAAYVDSNIVIRDSYIGIGTDDPLKPLHVYETVNTAPVRIETNLTESSIQFKDSTTTGMSRLGSKGNDLFFRTNAFERMRITDAGDVGIGTTNPSQLLDVNGNARFRENVSIGTDTSDARLTVDVGTGLTAFVVDGSEGQLFSVTNNLTSGSIFSVNDVSGVPSIDVDADGRVLLTPYGSNEYVGIGLTNPQAKLHVFGASIFEDDVNIGVGGTTAFFDISTGYVGIGSTRVKVTGVVTATDFNSTSDARLKTNVQVIEDPLEKVSQIEGVSFNWINNNKPSMGVIADNIQEVLPELVSNTDPKTVNYNGLIGLLIECVKQQQVEIEELKRKIG